MMADGYLNKCKTCAKADAAQRLVEKQKDPAWVEKERERSRLKMIRVRAEGREKKPSPLAKKKATRAFRAKHPEKEKAHAVVTRALRSGTLIRKPCVECGSATSEAHHDDYSKPLDVMWLCPKHHAARHREIRKAS